MVQRLWRLRPVQDQQIVILLSWQGFGPFPGVASHRLLMYKLLLFLGPYR
jgi:hypothetical protein